MHCALAEDMLISISSMKADSLGFALCTSALKN